MISARARRFSFKVGLTALPLAALAVLVVSAQAGSSSHLTPSLPRIYSHAVSAAQPVANLDAALQGRLTSFERAQTPQDVPPADILPADVVARGANRQLARLAGTFGDQSVYLVPASGGLCLASTSLLASGCFSSADVLADKVTGLLECYPYMPYDQQEIFGLFPGVPSVTLTNNDGSKSTAALKGDVFVIDAKPDAGSYPVSLSWSGAAGNQTLPTDMGQPLVPHPCTAQGVSPDGMSPQAAIAAARRRIANGQG